MMDPSGGEVLKAATVAAGAGSAARLAVAMLGGERSWVLLLIHAFVGAVLGIIAGGLIVYLDPTVQTFPLRVLVLAGFAGLAGAMGTKTLDMLAEALRRRIQ